MSFDLSGEVATELGRLVPERISRLVCVDARLATNCPSATNGSSAVPRTYLRCTAGSSFAAWTAPAAYRARAAGWDYCELPLNHASRIALPEEVVEQLLAFALIPAR